jgi:hypothetical protein
MRHSAARKRQPAPGQPDRQRPRRAATLAAVILGLSLAPLAPVLASPASAATPLNVFVGYMDTHTVGFSSNQPNPWPYTDPSSYDGTRVPAIRTTRAAGTRARSG